MHSVSPQKHRKIPRLTQYDKLIDQKSSVLYAENHANLDNMKRRQNSSTSGPRNDWKINRNLPECSKDRWEMDPAPIPSEE